MAAIEFIPAIEELQTSEVTLAPASPVSSADVIQIAGMDPEGSPDETRAPKGKATRAAFTSVHSPTWAK